MTQEIDGSRQIRDGSIPDSKLETPGGGSFPNPFVLTADITPAALAADQNNYDPTGLATADVLRLESSGAVRSITGLAGGADGRIILIHNIGATYNFVLVDESASSDAANRFALGGSNLKVSPGKGVILQYDSTLSRWYTVTLNDHSALINIGTYGHSAIDTHIDNTAVHLSFSDAEGDPAAIGTAADGTSAYAARRDHVHADPNLRHAYLPFGVYLTINPITAAASPGLPYFASADNGNTLTFVRWSQVWHVATTNNGSNYWTIELYRVSDSSVIAAFNTSAGAADTWTLNAITSFSITTLAAAGLGVFLAATKTGTPGALYVGGPELEVRI